MPTPLFAPTASAPPSDSACDVFNGDADGICALHQLRLAQPRQALLVTGTKRNVELLQHVPCEPDIDVTVMDISLDANHAALKRILDAGGRVRYFDHHSGNRAFEHPGLTLILNPAPQVCTSILVDRLLRGQFRKWAVVAAFGDNLPQTARALAQDLALSEQHITTLQELGTLLNYNAYGERVEDLHIAPATLYRTLHPFIDPLDFVAAAPQYRMLLDGYRSDALRMENLKPEWQSAYGTVFLLPEEPWAHRISGTFANRRLSADGNRACAVLTKKADGSFLVSVRSCQPAAKSANTLCERFSSGGGRKEAAGINRLPANEVERFVASFFSYFAPNKPPAVETAAFGH